MYVNICLTEVLCESAAQRLSDHQPSRLQQSDQRERHGAAEAAAAADLQPVRQTHQHLDESAAAPQEVHHHRLGLHPRE